MVLSSVGSLSRPLSLLRFWCTPVRMRLYECSYNGRTRIVGTRFLGSAASAMAEAFVTKRAVPEMPGWGGLLGMCLAQGGINWDCGSPS